MTTHPHRLRAAFTRTLCSALVLLSQALPAQAAPDAAAANCPPVAQPPTAEQMQAVQRDARDHGFLWRISKGGRASYLYGTLHVGKLAWSVPGPRVMEALTNSQTLALELDLLDEKIVAQLSSSMAAGNAKPTAMPAAWQTRMQRQVAAACLPAETLANQHPVMQAITLTVLAARRDGLDPAFAQEFVLSGLAHAVDKPVVSLETPAQQMAALLPSDAARARTMAEQALTQLEQGRARATLLRVAQVWERGDLEDLTQYERWCECITSEDDAAQLRKLNDERNEPLAERIDALHAGGKTVFAAVGSLHMTGPRSLPRLMGQRGYSVERVRF
ncbi:TraB/GumN family protein [Aquabacterium sp.]|uniref:TraB/GumN family protein n=1 Tax=Aquabacterium sp. TaxID=1872578 RepID=UPI002CA25DF6|nr:TraB/GumN family protein [Aquabacterium sp.]HSW03347.1 TraB/GumN family protein [Aquabacterium sp.]